MSKALRIKDFPDYYITDNGDVYSRQTKRNPNGRIKKLKPYSDRIGYLKVHLQNEFGKKIKLVHRLVAEAFIPNPNGLLQVNHKNGIKTDNNVKNLEWCSASENITHAYRVLHKKPNINWLGKFGGSHPRHKTVLQIQDGHIVAEFDGVREAARKTSIHFNSIAQCCRGKYKSAGGFVWKYK